MSEDNGKPEDVRPPKVEKVPPPKPRTEDPPKPKAEPPKPPERETAAPPPRTQATRKIQRGLEDLGAAAVIAFTTLGDERRADVIDREGAELARVWARYADDNPAVKRVLEGLLTSSSLAEVIFVTARVTWGMLPEDWESPFALPGFMAQGADEVPPSPEVRLHEEAENVVPIRPTTENGEPSAAPGSIPKSDGSPDDDPPGRAA